MGFCDLFEYRPEGDEVAKQDRGDTSSKPAQCLRIILFQCIAEAIGELHGNGNRCTKALVQRQRPAFNVIGCMLLCLQTSVVRSI